MSDNDTVVKFGQPERPEQESMTGYREAPDSIRKLGEKLIEDHHKHLEKARVLYQVYDDEMTYRGKRVPGRVYKVHDREKAEMKKDFEIVISEPVWEQIEEEGNEEAAMDFLLCFCTVGSSSDWATKDPDFYGFYNNIDRYGMWDRSLKNLEKKLKQTSIEV